MGCSYYSEYQGIPVILLWKSWNFRLYHVNEWLFVCNKGGVNMQGDFLASFKSSPHPFFVGTLTTVLALNFLPIIGRAISSSIGRSFPAAMSPRSRGPSFKTPLKSLFPWMSFYGTRFWSLHPSLLKTGNWVDPQVLLTALFCGH